MGPIAIKGGKDGLRLVLSAEATWDELLLDLHAHLGQGPDFFHGAELTIDTGERSLSEPELQALLAAMAEHGLHPSALATSSRESRSAGRAVGLTTKPATRPAVAPVADVEQALLVQRTLRSGQILRHPGHITVIGDVNPGAEVIASGSIVVWGRVRGKVHAGALGDTTAVVCAIELTPTLLQIGTHFAGPPATRPTGPEVAHLTAQGIEVEPWESSRR